MARKTVKINRAFTEYDKNVLSDEELEVFRRSRYTIKDAKEANPELTYRKLNDWDEKGLISPFRLTEGTGWRKLSILDLVRLFIISDLKKLGFENEQIFNLLTKIEEYECGDQEIKNSLAHLIYVGLLDARFILLIVDRITPIFLQENDDWENVKGIKNVFKLPAVILPFQNYIEKIWDMYQTQSIEANDPMIINIPKYIENERAKKIINIIKNEDYEEIKITRGNGDELLLRAVSRRRGSFSAKDVLDAIQSKDFQKVEVSVKNGEKIGIIREETIKV